MRDLKIHQLGLIAIGLLFFMENSIAQYKEFKINAAGDTINALNQKGLKQGKWVIRVEELRGEPGYEEEGVFENGIKEGIWRIYTLEGDLIAVENFKMGGKHGLQQYYTFLGELVREENWLGYDPEDPYDTIAVYGTGSNEIVEYKIVKAEQYSVKQGVWKYYEPATGFIIKTEEWDRNKLLKAGSTSPIVSNNIKMKPEKTPEMIEWEKKNKGKKKVVRDGKTGL